MADLTPKQEAFAQAYIETSSAAEAYRRAYNTENFNSDNALWVEAHRVKQNPNVALRIEQLRAEHKERHEMTIDKLTEMLNEDRTLARDLKQPDTAISAVLAIAKLHGLVVEKKNVTSDNRHHHTAEPLSPFAEHLAQVVGEGAEGATEGSLPN